MGKAKPRQKRNRSHKTQPTGIPSVKDTESEELELNTGKEDVLIQNIIDEVQSSNIEEKLNGLRTLADLAENSESVDIIIKYKVLKIIAPLLIDKNSEVRNLTAGVLRNLSATGSVEICERLVKEDIMTPILALLQQYSEWKPESKTENSDTLLQVVNILWNLCETNETALKYFSSANLLNILLRCLDYKTVGLDLSITVCQCLNSVAEDNSAVLSFLRSYETELLNLLSVKSEDNRKLLLLKTLAAGIVVNLSSSSSWLAPVLKVIAEALDKDVRALVSKLSSDLPLDSSPLTPDAVKSVEDAEALTQAQTMALEILANLTSSQDDEMDTESEGSASGEESEVNGWSETDATQPVAVSLEIQEGIEKYRFVSAVFKKVESLPENVMNIISSYTNTKTLTKRVVRLQCRAFLCLNNLVSVIDLEQLGGPLHLCSVVNSIIFQRLSLNLPQAECNSELLEAVTAAIRGILLRLASINFSGLEVTPHDLEVVYNIGLSPEPRVQANVIRIVGTLALLNNNDPLVVKMAGNYLLQSAEKQLILWLMAEALDTLLDLFAEDCTDQPAVEISLVPRLQALAPRLKSKLENGVMTTPTYAGMTATILELLTCKMRQERKTLGEHYPVVSTVMTNLTPFIRYKGARIASLNS